MSKVLSSPITTSTTTSTSIITSSTTIITSSPSSPPSAAAAKREYKKFGEAADSLIDNSNCTVFGEPVTLALCRNKNFDLEQGPTTLKITESKLLCRYCKGDHWSTKCPFKDTFAAAEETANASNSSAAQAAANQSSNKYISPSLRAGHRPAQQNLTVRITNLSEMTTDADLNLLVKSFGRIDRAFLSKDRDLGICKGFAFVTFADKESAEKAINTLNGWPYDSQILKAEWAKPVEDK